MKINMKEFTGKCSCGREHTLAVEQIYLEAGALDRIPDILSGGSFAGYYNFVMICDDNTYKAAGKRVEQRIENLRRRSCKSKRNFGYHGGCRLSGCSRFRNHP